MSLVLATAQRAFDAVPLYRALYGRRPERVEDVPFISASAFHRAQRPLDVITTPDGLRGVVPAFSRHGRRLPVAVLESEEEWRLRRDRLHHALSVLDATPAPSRRYAIVTDDSSGPFASDISNFLAWDRTACSIVFVWDSPQRVETALAAVSPDIVLVAGAAALVPRLTKAGRKLVACVPVDGAPDDFLYLDRLLVSDEMFVMGAAPVNEAAYRFDPRSVIAEIDPATGRLAVTTLAFNCFALVRYCLDLPVDPRPTDRDVHARL